MNNGLIGIGVVLGAIVILVLLVIFHEAVGYIASLAALIVVIGVFAAGLVGGIAMIISSIRYDDGGLGALGMLQPHDSGPLVRLEC